MRCVCSISNGLPLLSQGRRVATCNCHALLLTLCAPSQFSTLKMSNMQSRVCLANRKLSETLEFVNHRIVSDFGNIARGHEMYGRDAARDVAVSVCTTSVYFLPAS